MQDNEWRRVSLSGEPLLRFLLERDAFRLCPPLPADRFIRWCKDHGVDASIELLEQFEKKGLFLPLLRAKLPIYREKRREDDDGIVESLGRLEEGEAWAGEVCESYVLPDFTRHKLADWIDEGYIESVEGKAFVPWESFLDQRKRQAIVSYYSPFQIYTLDYQVTATRLPINAAFVSDYSDDDFERFKGELKQWASWECEPSSRLENPRFDAVLVAQAIATRYSPYARGDLRTITLPGNWDARAYAQSWSGAAVLSSLGITAAEIRRYYEMLDLAIAFADPLSEWDDLLSFVKLGGC